MQLLVWYPATDELSPTDWTRREEAELLLVKW